MNLREELIAALIAAKVSSPRLEADIILKHTAPDYPQISLEETAQARNMLARRLQNEPLDKIIGQREFYKSVFKVNENVLTPRRIPRFWLKALCHLFPKHLGGRYWI